MSSKKLISCINMLSKTVTTDFSSGASSSSNNFRMTTYSSKKAESELSQTTDPTFETYPKEMLDSTSPMRSSSVDAVRAPRKEPGDETHDVDRHLVGTKSRRDLRYHQVGKLNNSHERSPLKGCMYADYERSKERKRRSHFHQGKVHKWNPPISERFYNKDSHAYSEFDQKMDGKRPPTRSSGNAEISSHGNRHSKNFRDDYNYDVNGVSSPVTSNMMNTNKFLNETRLWKSGKEENFAPYSLQNFRSGGNNYVGANYISPLQYEHSSLLSHVESMSKTRERFSMPSISSFSQEAANDVSTKVSVKSELEKPQYILSNGPLNATMVLRCFLEMGAYKSKAENLLQVATSFLQEDGTSGDVKIICDVLMECVSSLLPKSAAYAALVFTWASMVETKESPKIETMVKDNPDTDEIVKYDAHTTTKSQKGKSLAVAAITAAFEALSQHLSDGKIIEAKNILCFLCELVEFHIIYPGVVVQLISQIVQLVEELIVAEDAQGDADFLVKVLLMGSLPWFPCCNDNGADALSSQCIERLIELYEGDAEQDGRHRFFLRDCKNILLELRHYFSTPKKIKTLPRILASANLPLVPDQLNYLITSIHPLKLTASNLRIALGKCRLNAFFLAEGGTQLDQRLGLPCSSAYGVCFENLWDHTALCRHLNGVRPLDILDCWVLRQLFESVIHAFSDTHTLCAEALLRLPVAHDQFEVELINFIFGEMLRQPSCLHPIPLFFYRVIQSLAMYQASLVPLIHDAIHLIVQTNSKWNSQILKTFTKFVALWLAGGSQLSAMFEQLNINRWSSSHVQCHWLSEWAPYGHVMTRCYFEDPSTDTVVEETFPESLCEFLTQLMCDLSDIVTLDVVKINLPKAFVYFLPNKKIDSNPLSLDTFDKLYEYQMLKNVVCHKFETEARRLIHLQRLEAFVRSYLLDKSYLADSVHEKIILFIRGTSLNLKKQPTLEDQSIKTEFFVDENMNDTSKNYPESQEIQKTSVIVKKQEEGESTVELTVDSMDQINVTTLVETYPLTYDLSEACVWTIGKIVELFLRVLIDHGSKTITHLIRAINNYSHFIDSLRHSYGERLSESEEIENFQTPIINVLFSNCIGLTKTRQIILFKLLVHRQILVPEIAQRLIFEKLSMDMLHQPFTVAILSWILEHALFKLCETCHNTFQEQFQTDSSDELHQRIQSAYQRLRFLATHHVVRGLQNFFKQEVQEKPQLIDEMPQKCKMDWINDSFLMSETSLRYLMGVACRFFYVVDTDFIENMVQCESPSHVHRLLASHVVAYIREYQRYFFSGQCEDVLMEMFHTFCLNNKSISIVKSMLETHEETLQ